MTNDAATILMTTPMRLSYPYLAKPKDANPNNPNGKPAYCFDGIVKKDDLKKSKEWQQIAATAVEVSKAAGQTFTPDQIFRMIFKDADLPNRNGNIPADANPDYKGHYIISFKSTYKPQMLMPDARTYVADEQVTQVLYPGCWIRTVAKPYAYNAPQNKGVALGFDMLQKVKDDTQFGGARKLAAEVFEPVAGEADNPDNYSSANAAQGSSEFFSFGS